MNHRLLTINIASYAAIMCLTAYITGILIEKPPIQYANIPFPTDKEQYIQGENVNIDVQICAEREVTYTFTQRFRNVQRDESKYGGYNRDFPTSNESNVAKEGCELISGIPKRIDERIYPGKWVIEATSTSRGMFRSHNTPWNTETFEVVEGTTSSTTRPTLDTPGSSTTTRTTITPDAPVSVPRRVEIKSESKSETKSDSSSDNSQQEEKTTVEKILDIIPSL